MYTYVCVCVCVLCVCVCVCVCAYNVDFNTPIYQLDTCDDSISDHGSGSERTQVLELILSLVPIQ